MRFARVKTHLFSADMENPLHKKRPYRINAFRVTENAFTRLGNGTNLPYPKLRTPNKRVFKLTKRIYINTDST